MPVPKGPTWKKGRGKLGILDPLLGEWAARADSPMGPVRCVRSFSRVLGDSWVELRADWEIGATTYQEHALMGVGADGALGVWSFTSDGKRSEGRLTEAPDVHPQAIAFESQMPAGLARQVYWPGEAGAVEWAVESKTKKGWNRFTQHHYTPAGTEAPAPAPRKRGR